MNKQRAEKIKWQLAKCRTLLNKGYNNRKEEGATNNGLPWLNKFCEEFLIYANDLQKFILQELCAAENADQLEIMYLCLQQIVVCIRQMERTIKIEDANGGGFVATASRQHFLDRINWCLDRLRGCLKALLSDAFLGERLLEENTYVDLMDLVLDTLAPYSNYNYKTLINPKDDIDEAICASKQIRALCDMIISHTLAFANVALQEDKKALSALCQKVLRECISFQDECNINHELAELNDCNRKLKAMSLEYALCQLEGFIDEALFRLIYTCFLDYNKLSIEKLRSVIRYADADDPALDELIADFDVNIDRTAQIGIFALAFTTDTKTKTELRSALASLESLDACLIPSLQTKHQHANVHSQILEQHFNEESTKFKNSVHDIIDSYGFAMCYHDILCKGIAQAEKDFSKISLTELVQKGEFLREHFQRPLNYYDLRLNADRMTLYEKFTLILNECQAILTYNEQIDQERILKRFKILRSVLRKFVDSLKELWKNNKKAKLDKSNVFIMAEQDEEIQNSEMMFESIGISPSIRSILYCNESIVLRRQRQRAASDSLKGLSSKLPIITTPPASPQALSQQPSSSSQAVAAPQTKKLQQPLALLTQEQPSNRDNASKVPRCSIRKNESLRTAMFKRQKSSETEKIYNIYKMNSASLHISEILDELANLSAQIHLENSHK